VALKELFPFDAVRRSDERAGPALKMR
jgi:hypothetical protein